MYYTIYFKSPSIHTINRNTDACACGLWNSYAMNTNTQSMQIKVISIRTCICIIEVYVGLYNIIQKLMYIYNAL